jgi:hypothetical protein
MRSAKMIDDALRVIKSEGYIASPPLFHNFDYALDELTCKLTEGVNMEVFQLNKRVLEMLLEIMKIHL